MSGLDSFRGDVYSILTAVFWSIAVVYFRLAGMRLKALPLKFFQNTVSALLFFALAFAVGEPLWLNLSMESWMLIGVSSFFGITLADTFYVASIQRVGAGAQAILDCLYAPTVIVSAFLLFDERLSRWETFGALLIVGAVALAASPSGFKAASPRDRWIGISLGILAQIAMGFTVVFIRDLLRQDSVITILAYRYVIGNGLLVASAALTGQARGLSAGFTELRTWPLSIPGTVLGPFVATLFWFLGFKHTLAGRAAVYNQLSSIFIIILATTFLKEPLTRAKTLALVLATAGGLLVGWSNG